ncbi:MAG: L,D-transpeptidase family protein [Candidatus Omnitrophota bacterium]
MRLKIILTLAIGVIIAVLIFVIIGPGNKRKQAKYLEYRIAEKNSKVLPRPDSMSKVMKEAENSLKKGDYALAKLKYQELVNNYPNSEKISIWQKTVDDINIKIILNGVMCDGFTIYEIQSGDSLSKIARQFNTTVDLIKKSNYLTSDQISRGRKLKIWTRKFSCFVDKSQNILLLKSKDEVIKSYVVSTGKDNSTPIGTFKIVTKIENPTWYKNNKAIPPSSPENILGTRWMGFDIDSYGIHGTTDPGSLGKQVTQGCVRMKNEDVEELYIFLPQGSEVTIVD